MSLSILRYPGGKSKARAIFTALINEFPDLEYRETFFGGGIVVLDVIVQAKRPSYWLNDSDGAIAALWQAVAFHPEKLKAAIMEVEPAVAGFDRLKAYLRSGPALPTGAEAVVRLGCDKLVLHRISYGALGVM